MSPSIADQPQQPLSSAAGLLALLDDDQPELVAYALQELDNVVHAHWTEIADSVSKLEILYEDAAFPNRQLAALLASKVYFHLAEFEDALNFALAAGPLFNVEQKSEYVDTVVSQAIDTYIKLSNDALPSEPSTSATGASQPSLASLKTIVDQMFERCISSSEFRQAVGIALETRRLDIIERVFSVSQDRALLAYTLDAVMTVVQSLDLRNKVLHLLVKLFQSLSTPDHFSISQCYVYLNAPELAATLLFDLVQSANSASSSSLINTENDPLLVASQIAFDLAESATQEFLEIVRAGILEKSGGKAVTASSTANDENMAVDEDAKDDKPSEASAANTQLGRIRSILQGEESIQLYLDFLRRSNKADLPVLKAIKDALDARNSVYHNALTFANAFAHAGTTSDQFLRDNLEWLAKASNWSKFSATAALGVINKGNLAEGVSILRPYLPGDVSSSIYSEGGSLFALGLIHSNHGSAEVMDLLRSSLRNNPSEVVQHGAALGLGAAGMATGSEEVYTQLRDILFTDSATASEAAAYAMGLVMLGTGSPQAVEEMLQYAHETQHEKIIRGLAMGLAMLFYGKEEAADTMIDTLMADKDAILRYGGTYTIALAYAGTGNNKAIKRLLHVAVSDVNDDVRRAAVTSLGFLLFRNPSQVPRIVELLSESYNPHVRYGSTLALGIACAGTGLDEALDLLEPMLKDPVDFVRQGASLALSMCLIQQNDALNPRVGIVRKKWEKILTDKHEDVMAKFGAALAQGLVDAGGRNVTIGLQNRGGGKNMPAIVGMALFTQFWYWFPLAHFASLAFSPTALIGLDRDLRIPEFEFRSNVRPSLFAYPTAAKVEKEKKVEKVETAVLSTTVKVKARMKRKEKEEAAGQGGSGMDVDEPATPAVERSTANLRAADDDAMKVDDEGGATGASKEAGSTSKEGGVAAGTTRTGKRGKQEPNSEMLPNYSRVVPAQLPYVDFPSEGRYAPVRPIARAGVSGSSTPSSGGKSKEAASAPTLTGTTESIRKAIQLSASSSAITSSTSSAGRYGVGILLLIDRKSGEQFVPLFKPESTGEEEGQQAGSGGDSGAVAEATIRGTDDSEEGAAREQTGVAPPASSS
ncbi:proteasome regulatory particle base subunit [Tilletia horrida]|uniref:26S proteasome regulatory subunit RPN2 n=1 Tax=Tilletia horrida TaxID=155126 RepID=A0AAN6GY44_9BASI|nr:proteasome regulatory particle base subunit [Tilletia horrida]KAK0570330.1 proteasome regulatory particle base subunit [Tilletia horrida]